MPAESLLPLLDRLAAEPPETMNVPVLLVYLLLNGLLLASLVLMVSTLVAWQRLKRKTRAWRTRDAIVDDVFSGRIDGTPAVWDAVREIEASARDGGD